jgi:beta-lactam-binding protein with PASTA domain
VIDQRPPAGAEVERGRTVVIVVGVFEEQPPPEESGGAPQDEAPEQ